MRPKRPERCFSSAARRAWGSSEEDGEAGLCALARAPAKDAGTPGPTFSGKDEAVPGPTFSGKKGGAPGPVSPRWRRKNWLRVGVQVRARKRETRSATVMVIARARKKGPVTPAIEMSGRNTTMGVMVEPSRGTKSSRRAVEMETKRDWPASR